MPASPNAEGSSVEPARLARICSEKTLQLSNDSRLERAFQSLAQTATEDVGTARPMKYTCPELKCRPPNTRAARVRWTMLS
jgi:capsular polysaccharide biosynthesis protein